MEIKKFKNYGVIPEIRQTDYVAGTLPYQVINPSGDWTSFVPSGENQYSNMIDSMACVSFSFLNCLETQLKFHGIELDFSDRFLAKVSNTTIHGNTLGIVADTYRQYGCPVEADWPKPDSFTWEIFYAEIPQEIKNKAIKYDISYEWIEPTVESLQYHLKQAPLQLIIPGHAIMGVYEQSDIFKYFDTYVPYLKEHANPPAYAFKIVLNIEKQIMTEHEVKNLYALAFYRLPDATELAFWKGKSLDEFLKVAIKDRAKFLESQNV